MAKKPAKPKAQPIQRNPVLLSLNLLRDLDIKEEEHHKFSPMWPVLWGLLVGWRDTMPQEAWNQDIYDILLSGEEPPTPFNNEVWQALNACLNKIWELAKTDAGEVPF